MRTLTIVVSLICLFAQGSPAQSEPVIERPPKPAITWVSWSAEVFERARKERKFVLLDLEAVWCHWCHVMDEITYHDPTVVDLVNRYYIAVRVDQDSRPDISNRYEDYGWPATIVFGPGGEEIVKRSGYIPPRPMASLLQAIVDDPSPGPSVVAESPLSSALVPELSEADRNELLARHVSHYDFDLGGWGRIHKFIDWNSVEFAMAAAVDGDRRAAGMVTQTLDAARSLIDPAWGGIYQYSAGGDWDEPHFEKIMSMQAENLRIYALAYRVTGRTEYLEAATAIERYLTSFLMSPDGAFYTSQDADLVRGEHSEDYFGLDDAARRRLGIPRIDKHVYSRENGWAIYGLAALYGATGDSQYLDKGTRAAEWILRNRSAGDGGFRHDELDQAGPYLGDTLAMGRAFLSLYAVTGERRWLALASSAAQFVDANFRDEHGFATARIMTDATGAYRPKAQRDENIVVARFANLLFHYGGRVRDREMANHAMKYLAGPIVSRELPTGGVLLADLELRRDPIHITVVGRKDDPAARALFLSALQYPGSYKRTDWFDRREGPLPNSEIEFPDLGKAAAFACSGDRCSAPAFSPEELALRVARLKPTNSTADKENR